MTTQVKIESRGSMAIKQKVVFVPGMHWSGTSCLAGMFPWVDFDWPADAYKKGVNNVITGLGISQQHPRGAGNDAIVGGNKTPHSQAAAANGFFDPSLRHWSEDVHADLPGEIESTCLALRERAGQGA